MPTAGTVNPFLYGLDEQYLKPYQTNAEQALLHAQAVAPFLAMQAHAYADGIELDIASGYRAFTRQQAIWDRKFQHPSRSHLAPLERLADITQWSALPGTSRHHWGTDIDLFDASKIARNALTLEPWEYANDGPCHALYTWLVEHAPRYGFFRPYDLDRGGVKPEPWHWSYAPVAEDYLQMFDSEQLKGILRHADLAGLNPSAEYFDAYIESYVRQFVFQVARP